MSDGFLKQHKQLKTKKLGATEQISSERVTSLHLSESIPSVLRLSRGV